VADDSYLFGQIAAANSLSDVYAMGARVLTAMNILCIPKKGLEPERVAEILAGGADKVRESGGALVGGHTVENPELVFGLSVTGAVHPDKLLTNAGAKPGDTLVLTKPLGTGLVNSLVKAGRAAPEEERAVAQSMSTLNRYAAELMTRFDVHAVTDVTGFGLAGHALGMARQSGCSLEIHFNRLPLLPGVDKAMKSRRTIPAGTKCNYESVEGSIDINASGAERAKLIVCDPQTSGGLLVSLPESEAEPYVKACADSGIPAVAIGEAVEGTGRLTIL